MRPELEEKPCSFRQIKARLDPDRVYVVFETAAASREGVEFVAVKELLQPYRELIVKEDVHHDTAASRSLMVVGFDARHAPRLQELLMNPKLPRNVRVYLYGQTTAHPQAGVAGPR